MKRRVDALEEGFAVGGFGLVNDGKRRCDGQLGDVGEFRGFGV